jgi:hypothetical protein
MKKYLFSMAAVALGLGWAGTAQAARGPHGGPTMVKSVTSGGSTYRTFTPAKGTTVKTSLPAKTGTTFKKTTTVKKTVTGTGSGKGTAYAKGSGKVAPKWIKFGGKNYKTLSAGSKFKFRCWHKGYGCWCFYDRGCGWCFWCARYSCFLPYGCISYVPPGADDEEPEVGGEMPPVLPGTVAPKPKTETPPPPPPGVDGDGEKASTKDGDKDGEKASTKDGAGEKDAEKAGTKDGDTDGDSDS